MRICPKCHEEYIDDIQICPECGHPVMEADRHLIEMILSVKNPRKLVTAERAADAEEIEEILKDYRIDFYIGKSGGAEEFFVSEENLSFARNVIRKYIKKYGRKHMIAVKDEEAQEAEEYRTEDWELHNPEEETSMKIFNGVVIGFVLFAIVILIFGD